MAKFFAILRPHINSKVNGLRWYMILLCEFLRFADVVFLPTIIRQNRTASLRERKILGCQTILIFDFIVYSECIIPMKGEPRSLAKGPIST